MISRTLPHSAINFEVRDVTIEFLRLHARSQPQTMGKISNKHLVFQLPTCWDLLYGLLGLSAVRLPITAAC